MPDLFFWDGFYLRIQGGDWYASKRSDGDWKPRAAGSLPRGLRKKYAKQGKSKSKPGKGKGHAPAKGRW